MKQLHLFSFLCLLAFSTKGQKSAVLSSYIQAGLQSSLALKQENLELEKAQKAIDIARSNLFPKITFSPTYSLAAGGRSLEFPIGDLLNPVYSTLNKLTQSNNFPQVENVNQLLAPNNFHETKIGFQYPIFNADIKNGIAIQKELLQTEFAKKKYLEYELRHAIEIAYFQYLQSAEATKIYEQSRNLLERFVELNQKLVANHVALKDALLTAEYEVIKLDQQITVAHKNKEMAKAYINFLLNRDFTDEVIIDSLLLAQLPPQVSLDFLQENAQRHRPEFGQLQSGIRVNQAAIIFQEKNAKLPQVFVGGNTGFQGFGYKFSNQAFLIAQLGMQWELFHGYEKKHKIEQAKISKSITEIRLEEAKKQISLQILQRYKEWQSAVSSVKTIQGSTEKTTEIHRIIDSRYRNGNALSIEVLKAQNEILQAKLMESIAKYDVWVKFSELKKASGLE